MGTVAVAASALMAVGVCPEFVINSVSPGDCVWNELFGGQDYSWLKAGIINNSGILRLFPKGPDDNNYGEADGPTIYQQGKHLQWRGAGATAASGGGRWPVARGYRGCDGNSGHRRTPRQRPANGPRRWSPCRGRHRPDDSRSDSCSR